MALDVWYQAASLPSAAALDALRAEVTQSQWAMDFRADMRSSVVVRAVEVRARCMETMMKCGQFMQLTARQDVDYF